MQNNGTGTNKIFFTIFGFLLGIVAVCCACFTLLLGLVTSVGNSTQVASIGGSSLDSTPNQILVVNIKGTILNEAEDSPSSILGSAAGTFGYEIKEIFKEAADNDNVKAIILEVSSPGGTVTGSNAIAEGIEYFKEQTDKPVIGFGFGVVASGGYWAIAPTDKIIVDEGTTIGSIGVISGELTYYDGLIAEGQFLGSSYETTNGIERYYISAGEGKGLGYPFQKPTQKALDNLQAQADSVYEDFVAHVNKYRPNLTKKEIKDEIGAYVYDTANALEIGLIDERGSKDDAIAAAVEAAGLDSYTIVEKPSVELDFFSSLLSTAKLSLYNELSIQNTNPHCVLQRQAVIAYHGNLTSCN